MRDILYRGKPKEDGEYYFFSQIWKDNCKDGFVYGSLVVDNGRCYICVSAMRNINICINNGMTSMIEVIPETVGQYIGLIDTNNKKIFEGDYVVMSLHEGGHSGVIYYSPFTASFKIRNKWGLHIIDEYYWVEVKGNIHDNPELLG